MNWNTPFKSFRQKLRERRERNADLVRRTCEVGPEQSAEERRWEAIIRENYPDEINVEMEGVVLFTIINTDPHTSAQILTEFLAQDLSDPEVLRRIIRPHEEEIEISY